MRVITQFGWEYYIGDDAKTLVNDKCGKWMYFFDNKTFVSNLCAKAVESGVVVESKHSNAETGVSCFYLNGDDIDGHKKVIQFFLDNNLIKRTKSGKLYNISFKFDNQTRAGKYGGDFIPEIKLEQFLDLTTGEWK